jgi:diadenosine tetraphosphate (Ap4A) HIT family hydrolase
MIVVGTAGNALREGLVVSRPTRLERCDYCLEIAGDPDSTFGRYYGGVLPSRLVASSDNFLAWPTLGQLIPGTVLVLPRQHAETMASLEPDARSELARVVAGLAERLASEVVLYEHGATAESGGGCGISHAHLHVSPVESPLDPSVVFDAPHRVASGYFAALEALGSSRNYLVFEGAGRAGYVDVMADGGEFPSQYFRQRLASVLEAGYPWDWRLAPQPEERVTATFERLTDPGVPR